MEQLRPFAVCQWFTRQEITEGQTGRRRGLGRVSQVQRGHPPHGASIRGWRSVGGVEVSGWGCGGGRGKRIRGRGGGHGTWLVQVVHSTSTRNSTFTPLIRKALVHQAQMYPQGVAFEPWLTSLHVVYEVNRALCSRWMVHHTGGHSWSCRLKVGHG